MELNDREKFIVHFMSATIFGMRDNASDLAVNCAIEKLRRARCENLSAVDAQKMIDEVLDEATRGAMVIMNKNVKSEDLV
mgnify:FL=1